jgi:hypothetical protein
MSSAPPPSPTHAPSLAYKSVRLGSLTEGSGGHRPRLASSSLKFRALFFQADYRARQALTLTAACLGSLLQAAAAAEPGHPISAGPLRKC